MDTENVQPETVSEESHAVAEGAVLPEVETPPKVEEKQPEEQPFTEVQEAKLQQLIAQTTETAKETGRREMQGIKDREVAQALQRARFAEDNLASMGAEYSQLDPLGAETARLKAIEKAYKGDQQRQQSEQQTLVARQTWYEGMGQSVTEMGVNVNDKRIDWAFDAPNADTAQRRILSSVGKIQREESKVEKGKLEQQLKDFKAETRKELGLETVDTTTSAGVVGGDAEFKRKFGAGEVPMTPANVDRYNKITSSY